MQGIKSSGGVAIRISTTQEFCVDTVDDARRLISEFRIRFPHENFSINSILYSSRLPMAYVRDVLLERDKGQTPARLQKYLA